MIRIVMLTLALVAAASDSARAASPPTMAAGELRPGQKAVVRTVFSGTEIGSFDAEIVGVLRGGRAGGDLILGRATTEQVVQSGIAQGMSGSPVYVDGKLIGALSVGWGFSRDPVFGITPIGEMLTILEQPERAGDTGATEPTGLEPEAEDLAFGAFRWTDPDETAVPSAPGARPAYGARNAMTPELAPLAIPVSCAGLHAGALDQARDWLRPFGLAAVPGGAATGKTAPSLEPGSAAAVEMMRGDLELAAIGTVTWRDGDRVLLFGHPFFQSGAVRLPLASAEIVTIVASDNISFKLGVRSSSVGVVTQDRRTGLGGRIGGRADMLPIAVSVAGTRPQPQAFHFESIEDRSLGPTLIAIATLNSVLESGGSGGRQTLRWTVNLHRAGAPPLAISGVAAGESPPNEMAQGVIAPLAFLWSNPFERLSLDSVSVSVRATPGRASWLLHSARVLDPVVRPGGRVRVLAEIERWQGRSEAREVTLSVPRELPDGRYNVFVGGNDELERFEARSAPGRYRPTSLDEAWRRIGAARPPEGLYVAITANAPEVTSYGRDYPELPLSALSLLAPSQAAGDGARRGSLAIVDERHLPLDGTVQGQLMLSVQVDRRAP